MYKKARSGDNKMKINISDEDGRDVISDVSIFDKMTEKEANIVFGD